MIYRPRFVGSNRQGILLASATFMIPPNLLVEYCTAFINVGSRGNQQSPGMILFLNESVYTALTENSIEP